MAEFIRGTFRSVWAIELLCHLRREPERLAAPSELVGEMRASDLVIRQSLERLILGGLVAIDGAGLVRYAPASGRLDALAAAACAQYAKNPDATRRMIVTSASPGIAAFANAFRLRKD